MNLFPLVAFEITADCEVDQLLVDWGHWLGGCNRPFGRQSFRLVVGGRGIVAVAVSASTVNKTCGGFDRKDVIELARLCSKPSEEWATRVMLRLWREVAPKVWPYWVARALVSYSNSVRHTGNIYRFDGWRKVGEVPGGVAGGNWTRGKRYDPKAVWVWDLKS